MAWRVHASNLQEKQKVTYTGPVSGGVQVYEDAPFEVTYKKEHMNKDADSPAGIVRSSFKNIPLPGTEDFAYPKQSLTWMPNKNVWVAINSYTHDETRITKSIGLDEWINNPVTRGVLNDEKLIMHFSFKNAVGAYISEDEAIAINKKFDVDATVKPETASLANGTACSASASRRRPSNLKSNPKSSGHASLRCPRRGMCSSTQSSARRSC